MIKKAITINRDVIENALMACKDFIKKKKKHAIALGVLILLLAGAATGFAAYYQQSKEKSLYSLGKIISDLQDANFSDEAKITAAVKIADLKKKSHWGYVSTTGFYMAGGLYFDVKKYDEALKYYNDFVKNEKSSFLRPFALFQIGACYEMKSDYEKAFDTYKMLEKEYPKSEYSDHILYDLGRMYQKKGDAAKAKEYFEKVKADYQDSLFSYQASQRLMLLDLKK